MEQGSYVAELPNTARTLLLLLHINASHAERWGSFSALEEIRAGQSHAHRMDLHVENCTATEPAAYLKRGWTVAIISTLNICGQTKVCSKGVTTQIAQHLQTQAQAGAGLATLTRPFTQPWLCRIWPEAAMEVSQCLCPAICTHGCCVCSVQ